MIIGELLELNLSLPGEPKIIALLLSELNQSKVDLKRVNQLVGTDPAMTWRVLQQANDTSPSLGGKIHSVAQALAMLHMDQVRSQAQAAAACASLKSLPGISMKHFWGYCRNVASISRSLAWNLRQNQQAAYTCGLIHAIGELALQQAMPQALAALNEHCKPLDLHRAALQTKHLGFSYGQVGAGLARRWQFPSPMVNALEHLDAPFENQVYEPLSGIIHLATWRARCEYAKRDAQALAVSFPSTVGLALGLDIDMVLQQTPFNWQQQGD
jgi:HD-like signal output (HDOD) protein